MTLCICQSLQLVSWQLMLGFTPQKLELFLRFLKFFRFLSLFIAVPSKPSFEPSGAVSTRSPHSQSDTVVYFLAVFRKAHGYNQNH